MVYRISHPNNFKIKPFNDIIYTLEFIQHNIQRGLNILLYNFDMRNE